MKFKPLTPKRWRDFEKLFSEHGVQNGCWCMYWRLTRQEFYRGYGSGNKKLMRKIVQSRKAPGLIAYSNGEPVGWCSIAPREHFPVLDRSPTLKRIDDQPVWSITCFFVSKKHRGRGLSRLLIIAAIDHARKHGARIIEAYPLREPLKQAVLKWEMYTGLERTFAKLGFFTVSRRSKLRSIMRYRAGLNKNKDHG